MHFDRKLAVECAARCCCKVAQMGRGWCRWDGLGEAAIFRKVELQGMEVMTKQWNP